MVSAMPANVSASFLFTAGGGVCTLCVAMVAGTLARHSRYEGISMRPCYQATALSLIVCAMSRARLFMNMFVEVLMCAVLVLHAVVEWFIAQRAVPVHVYSGA